MEPIQRTFAARDGVKLFTQVVEKGASNWLICTHGIGEHLGRHQYLTELLGHDFNVFYYDLRGHGRSSGEMAYVSDFNLYLEDLQDCIKYLEKKYDMKKFVLFGHSMGALITCGFAQKYFTESFKAEAIFVNAPPVGIPGGLGMVVNLIPNNFLGKLASFKQSLPVGGLVDLKYLSHKNSVAKDYEKDELNHMKLHSKLLLELVNFSRKVFSKPIDCKVPAFCSYGSEDGIINVSDLENYFTKIEDSFELKCIDGAYHEIHNEIERYRTPYLQYLKESLESIIYKK